MKRKGMQGGERIMNYELRMKNYEFGIQNSGGICSVVEKAVKWGGGEMKNYE